MSTSVSWPFGTGKSVRKACSGARCGIQLAQGEAQPALRDVIAAVSVVPIDEISKVWGVGGGPRSVIVPNAR